MFGKNKPFKVAVETNEQPLKHEISIDQHTLFQTRKLVAQVGATSVLVMGAAAVFYTASESIIHIVKTQIK